jgi:hypothetical protein
MEEYNLKDEIRRLKEKIDGEESIKEKKSKKFKIPFNARVKIRELKKNYVTVLYLKNNHTGDFIKVPIDESSTMINGIPRIATPEEIIYIDGKTPLIIQPEWSVKPISISDSYEKSVQKELTSEGFSILLNRMKKEAIIAKKKMSGWLIILIIAIIGILGFFLLGGGKLLGFK